MKKISENLTWMAAANIVSSVFNGLIFIILARRLQAQAFGEFSFAQSLVFYLFNFIDLGLSTYGIREIAKDKARVSEYVSNIVSLRFIIAVVLYLICFLALLFVAQPIQFKLLMLLMLFLLFSCAFSTEWAFQGIEKMQMVLISFTVTLFFQLGLILILIKSPKDLLATPIIIFIGALPIIFAFLRILKFKIRVSRVDFSKIKKYFQSAIIIWSISLFAQVYNGLDIVILGIFRNASVVGYFSVARRFVSGIILFAIFLANAALPRLSVTFKEDLNKFKSATNDFLKLTAVLGLLLFVPFVLFIDKIIYLTVGGLYLPASLAVKILVLGAILVVFNLPFSTGLIAAGLEKEVLKQTIASAVLDLLLNFTLIPKFGMIGAAISFFYAEALGLVWILWVHHKRFGLKPIADK